MEKASSKLKGVHDKKDEEYINLLKEIKGQLENDKMIYSMNLSNEQKASIKSLNLLTAKPILYVYNVDENEKVRNNVPTLGGNQEMWFLTEDGLYEVLMLSRKTMAIEYDCKSKNSLTFTILYVIMYI